MSLKIVIGFPQPGNRGTPFPVYIGPLGSEALEARAACKTAASFLVQDNPDGLIKSNPAFDPAAPQPRAAGKSWNKGARDAALAAKDEEIARLKKALADLETAAPPSQPPSA